MNVRKALETHVRPREIGENVMSHDFTRRLTEKHLVYTLAPKVEAALRAAALEMERHFTESLTAGGSAGEERLRKCVTAGVEELEK